MKTRPALIPLSLVSAVALLATVLNPFARAQTTNPPPSVLLTIEGKVNVASAGTLDWKAGRTNQILKVGERVHTGERSRATIRLSDLSVLRVNELTTLEIRPLAQPGQRMLLDLKAGRTYLFNREKPTELQFRTPLASGAIRGTEFELGVDEATGRTVLTLLEGAVTLGNAQDEITLASGEQGVVEPGQPPRKSPVIDAINVIQWSLYYPAVLDVDEAGLADAERQALADSLAAYRSGDLLRALDAYPANRQPASDPERVYRAALLLTVGQVGQTETVLGGLTEPSPLAGALRRLIAAVKNQTDTNPVPLLPRFDFLPGSGTVLLAESYYQQSRSNLKDALAAARKAVLKSTNFGGAWIRVAELEMSFGRMGAALDALDRGLELSPRHAAGHALRGYALARQGRTRQAEQSFNDAIALDGALGNAWLGRGLCRFRHGDRADGREDLQVAATLEPQRALLRSYLGKAFAKEGDLRRAEKELNLARDSDPNDPTAWLYLALLQREENRINEAIDNLEKSKALNDNRGIYQSRFGLEQDQATRSANLAGIYLDAGLTDWSVREASRSVSADYGNYSAHLFLANSYNALRDPKLINLRYETAWLSEQLTANLLAPAAAGAFPLNIAEEPYTRLFDGNHLGVVNSTEYFSSGQWIQRGSQYGILGNSSWSLDAYYQWDPGQRPNNDFEQTALSATFKQQLTAKDSLLLRAEHTTIESGDVAQYFFQTDASRTQRIHERQDPNVFLGWHREWGPGVHTLFLGGYLEDNLDFDGAFDLVTFFRAAGPVVPVSTKLPVRYETDFKALSGELQQIWQNERHAVVVGGRVQGGTAKTQSSVLTSDASMTNYVAQRFENDLLRASAYAYWSWQVVRPLQLQAGLSYDYLDFPENTAVPPISDDQERADQLSPKAGFTFTPWTNTILHGAWTRSLGGVYFDTSVRLEPTQVGGFNQAFRSVAPESIVGLVPGTSFETFGLALEQKFPTRTYVTLAAELLYSDAARAIGALDTTIMGTTASELRQTVDFRERSLSATVNQLLGNNWSVGANWRLTDADLRAKVPDLDAFPQLANLASQRPEALLHQVTLFANYQSRRGFFGQAWSVWSHQESDGYPVELADDFWQHNLAVGWRLPRRRAELRVSLLNIFDRDYRLNPLTLYQELPRERTLAVGLKFYF